MDDLADEPSGRSPERRPTHSSARAEPKRASPLANTVPPIGDLDGVVGGQSSPRRRALRPAAATPRSRRAARRAPSSTRTRPRAGQGEGDPRLAPGQAHARGRATVVPTPPTPATASASDVGAIGRGDDAPHPAPGGHARRGELGHHSAAADASLPGPPATPSKAASTAATSSTRVASATRRGSASKSPSVSVRRTRHSAPTQVGDEGGEAVVVAEADLVVGHGVVLVDDRHRVEADQGDDRCRGRAGTGRAHRSPAVTRGPAHSAVLGPRRRRRRRASAGAGRSPRAPAGWSAPWVGDEASTAASPAETAPEVTTITGRPLLP